MSDRDKTGGKRRGAGSSSALNEPKKKVAKTNQASVSERLNSPYYDCFGHKLPTDPAEGIDKIIPYDLEKWKCDICSLECANRVGLINHRKTHWKGKTPLHRRQQHQPPPMAERNKTPQQNPEPCPSTSRESSDPEEERLRPTSAQSPLLAATADAPDIDAFAPMEDDFSALKAKRLKEFSTSQLLEALINREKLYTCHCGAIFQDSVLYHLHRGSHHDEDPMRCAFCKEKMKDWYAFQTHFFQHKRKVDD